MKKIAQVFVGVDVSKKHLDAHIYPLKKNMRVENTDQGIQDLIRLLSDYNVIQLVVEPTGGYEQKFLSFCKEAKFVVWMVNPKRIRAFIVSEGINAKTDKIDAQMIALFAAKKERPSDTYTKSQLTEEIRSLVRRRDDLIGMIAAEKNRVSHPSQTICKTMIKKHLTFMEKQLALLEEAIERKIAEDEYLDKKMAILTSIPGVGPATASKLIAEMPELGNVSNKKIAALLGVAPFIRQSGMSKGKAAIQGGRHQIRHTFYMASLVGARHNKMLKEFYLRLKAAGKPTKVAIVAVMRKLIVIINVMLRKGETWKIDECLT